MRSEYKKCLGIGLSMAGAMIGVGLASGREVVSFFAKFGYISLLFAVLAGLMFFVLSLLIFNISQYKILLINQNNKKCKNQQKYNKTDVIGGERRKIFKNINVSSAVLYVSGISLTAAMFAGLKSAMFLMGLNICVVYLLLIVVLISAVYILTKSKSLVFSFNIFLTTMLLGMGLFIFIFMLCKSEFQLLQSKQNIAVGLFMPLLYAGMNVLTAYPLLLESGALLKTKRERILAAFFIAFIVSIVLIIMCLIILLFAGELINDDMVIASIALKVSPLLNFVYLILICLAILSTLLSTAYGAVSVLKVGGKRFLKVFITMLISFALSFIGFTKIVDIIYPVLGLICLVYIVCSYLIVFSKVRRLGLKTSF